MIPDREKVQRGAHLIKTGWLLQMRQAMGISRNHLAGLLQSHGNHVRKWESGLAPEDGGVHWVHFASALRVADVHDAYLAAVSWLESEDLNWSDLVPVPTAAHQLGISVATLRRRMGLLAIETIDLGILGEWITKAEARSCRK
jgi:hypothetical protein